MFGLARPWSQDFILGYDQSLPGLVCQPADGGVPIAPGVRWTHEDHHRNRPGWRIVVEGEVLPEGAKVTVLAPESRERFTVSPEEKDLLLQSLAQAASGQVVDSEDLLRELDEPN